MCVELVVGAKELNTLKGIGNYRGELKIGEVIVFTANH